MIKIDLLDQTTSYGYYVYIARKSHLGSSIIEGFCEFKYKVDE